MSDTEKEPLLLVNPATDLTPEETENPPEPDPQTENVDPPVSTQPDKAQTLPRTSRQLSFSFQERARTLPSRQTSDEKTRILDQSFAKTLPSRQTSDEKTRILDQSFGGTTCYGSEFQSMFVCACLKFSEITVF